MQSVAGMKNSLCVCFYRSYITDVLPMVQNQQSVTPLKFADFWFCIITSVLLLCSAHIQTLYHFVARGYIAQSPNSSVVEHALDVWRFSVLPFEARVIDGNIILLRL